MILKEWQTRKIMTMAKSINVDFSRRFRMWRWPLSYRRIVLLWRLESLWGGNALVWNAINILSRIIEPLQTICFKISPKEKCRLVALLHRDHLRWQLQACNLLPRLGIQWVLYQPFFCQIPSAFCPCSLFSGKNIRDSRSCSRSPLKFLLVSPQIFGTHPDSACFGCLWEGSNSIWMGFETFLLNLRPRWQSSL